MAAVDWAGLEQVTGSFVDAELKASQSDLLYRAPLRGGPGDALLYVLFEHQRRLDYQMPLRLLQYMVRIWTRWQAEHGDRFRKPALPLIVPMVLYNGSRRWTVSTDLVDLFPAGPLRAAMASMIPGFRYIVQDLSQMPDEDIQGAALGQMIMLLLKWADRDDFWDRLPAWLLTMQAILDSPAHGIETVEALLRYIMSVAAVAPPDTIRPALREHLTPRAEEAIMTWASQLKQQGIEQGIEQGTEQVQRAEQQRWSQRVLRMLRLKFGDVSEAVVQRVEAGTLEELEQWAENILFAERSDAVFGD